MKKQDFEELLTSVRQAGKIKRGEARLSKVTEYHPVDVKAIRQRLVLDSPDGDFGGASVKVTVNPDPKADSSPPPGPIIIEPIKIELRNGQL